MRETFLALLVGLLLFGKGLPAFFAGRGNSISELVFVLSTLTALPSAIVAIWFRRIGAVGLVVGASAFLGAALSESSVRSDFQTILLFAAISLLWLGCGVLLWRARPTTVTPSTQ